MDQTGAIIGPLIVAWMVVRSHVFGPAFLALGGLPYWHSCRCFLPDISVLTKVIRRNLKQTNR